VADRPFPRSIADGPKAINANDSRGARPQREREESSGRLNMYTPMHILADGIGKDRGGFANRPAARCIALACNRAETARSRGELMTAREHTRDSTVP